MIPMCVSVGLRTGLTPPCLLHPTRVRKVPSGTMTFHVLYLIRSWTRRERSWGHTGVNTEDGVQRRTHLRMGRRWTPCTAYSVHQYELEVSHFHTHTCRCGVRLEVAA